MEREQFDKRISDALLLLVRLSLGLQQGPESFAGLQKADWQKLTALAREQTVLGLQEKAVRQLPKALCPPDDILVELMLAAETIRRRNRFVTQWARTILGELQQRGTHPILIKGPSVAGFYPDPELRAPGDLDFYFPAEELQTVLSYFKDRGRQPVRTPDDSYFCQDYRPEKNVSQGVDIDIHTVYFDLHCPLDRLPAAGTPEARLLMLSSHILKHAMGPGVGLRQFCDMAMAYRSLDGQYNKENMLEYYRRSGTVHWHRVLDAFLQQHFHIASGVFTDAPSRSVRKDARKLEEIVFSGGNFGHFKGQRKRALALPALRRKTDTAFRFLQRMPFSFRCAPKEYCKYVKSLILGNLRP